MADGGSGSLPAGTVTFLFTDIERSTELLVALGTDYPALLAAYRERTDAAVTGNGGVIFGSEGDGLFAAFPGALGAVAAATAAQIAYRDQPWPGDARVLVRMGLHTGTPTLIGGDYTGLDVHRAARIAAAAWGGQVVLSETTRALVAGSGIDSHDLGWFSMKGLTRPERVYQLDAPDPAAAFPPLRARPRSVDLPAQLTTLIGRNDDVGEVLRLVEQGSRLVTLTGLGGIGKSRIALAAAERLQSSFTDGITFVDLSAEEDAAQVAAAIATRLGVSGDRTRPAIEVVAEHLAPLQMLLVLDGFERVAAAATDVAAMLGRCAGLQILVTSRAALRLGVEREYRVGPLHGADPNWPNEQIAEAPAVRLFVDRVQAVRPGFKVTEENGATIAALVAALEGVPLSIELAAARARLLPPEAILQRLGAVLDLATTATDLPARQRSLRSTIEWSHSLLEESEQRLLRRLAVFIGGWTIEAAEAVCGGDGVVDVLDGLEALASHSMIVADGDGRMDMGTALREFAGERLVESGEDDATWLRHAEFFATMAREIEPTMHGRRQRELVARLSKDWGNFRAAGEWTLRTGHLDLAGSMYVDTWILAWHGDHWLEAESYTGRFIGIADRLEEPLRARVLFIAAGTYMQLGRGEEALRYARPAVQLASALGDRMTECWSRLMIAGSVIYSDVASTEAREQIDAAVDLARGLDDPFTLGYALSFKGTISALDGDVAGSLLAHAECLEVAESIDNVPLLTQAYSQQAMTHLVAGNAADARRCLEAGADSLDQVRSLETVAIFLDSVAWLAFAEDDPLRAMTALGSSDATRDRLGLARWALLESLLQSAGVAVEAERPELAAARRAGSEMDPRDAIALTLARHHEMAA